MKLLIFVFLTALIATAQSLQCYQCTDCPNTDGLTSSTCESKTTEKPPITDETTETETTDETTTEAGSTEAPSPESLIKSKLDLLMNNNLTLKRQRRDTADEPWYCYEVHYKDKTSNNNKIDRGCVILGEGKTCKNQLENILNGEITNCETCQNNGCNNGSTVIQLSLLAIIAAFIIKTIV